MNEMYATNNTYEFVNVSHPRDINRKENQTTIRQHAIRSGLRRSQYEQTTKQDNLTTTRVNRKSAQVVTKRRKPIPVIIRAPSLDLMDPFQTLCRCPERLRALARHPLAKQAGEPVFRVSESGSLSFQGTKFQDALADPLLFYALSLILALAANNNVINPEILMYRGQLLGMLGSVLQDPQWTPSVSTITAMLVLIGYEYRVEGATSDSVATHIRGLQAITTTQETQHDSMAAQVQRALFWQDLISCLVTGTPRLLPYKKCHTYKSPRDMGHVDLCVVPSGFMMISLCWPADFAVVLEDLNALCYLVDEQSIASEDVGDESHNVVLMAHLDDEAYPVDNTQAVLESRLVDLLSESRGSSTIADLIYEACLFATFLCTYKLSAGIWEGQFVPEFCVSQLLHRITKSTLDLRWRFAPELLLWLLFVAGGLTEMNDVKSQVACQIRNVLHEHFGGQRQDWELLKCSLKKFIWSERAMERRFSEMWEKIQRET